jgi:hypothetical protein
VKYKLSTSDWNRGDLYQTIAFAEAFGASRGIVVRFRRPDTPGAAELRVGRKSVSEAAWVADESASAIEAGRRMVEEVARWLGPRPPSYTDRQSASSFAAHGALGGAPSAARPS